MLIAMAGLPGAGKSTIAEQLAARLERRPRDLAIIVEPTGNAVEQWREEYAPWTGVAEQRPRLRLTTVRAASDSVNAAVAFQRP